ncbi:hypothetical protein EDB84DRAFT_1606690 [Lactarius hengduanensis]|nr:hypothetical protein EDB84DRAFT_1606690 [Lactarius hengduanensis]
MQADKRRADKNKKRWGIMGVFESLLTVKAFEITSATVSPPPTPLPSTRQGLARRAWMESRRGFAENELRVLRSAHRVGGGVRAARRQPRVRDHRGRGPRVAGVVAGVGVAGVVTIVVAAVAVGGGDLHALAVGGSCAPCLGGVMTGLAGSRLVWWPGLACRDGMASGPAGLSRGGAAVAVAVDLHVTRDRGCAKQPRR